MCIEPVAGCATMSYLPSLYCLRSSIHGTCAFAPDRPVLLAALLDGEAHHGLWIDAVHAARLFFRRMALERIAEDQQALRRRPLAPFVGAAARRFTPSCSAAAQSAATSSWPRSSAFAFSCSISCRSSLATRSAVQSEGSCLVN